MTVLSPLQQKSDKLYLKLRVHHLSFYDIKLGYKEGKPSSLVIDLHLINYLSTPQTDSSRLESTNTKVYSPSSSEHIFLPLFNTFERNISTILRVNKDIKKLRRGKKRNMIMMGREVYKKKLKELEAEKSQNKKEIKRLLVELFKEN